VLTPEAALEFLDPGLPPGPAVVDLVRLLVAGDAPSHPIIVGEAGVGAELVARLSYHRLLPQLIAGIAHGHVVAEGGVSDEMAPVETRLAVDGLRLELMLLEVGELLERADVEFLVLKGVATGRLDHAVTGLRQAADVDLLVRPYDFERAGLALTAAGFVRPAAEATLMDKGASWKAPNGVSLDLHTRPHTAGRALRASWWERSEIFNVAGRPFRALERGGRMAHAASHYALSYPNHRILSSLLDLVTISRLAVDADRARAQQFLAEVGVSDIALRITRRAAVLVGDESLVLGRRGSRPLDLALRKAYDRSDLDKVALKLAKTFGMPGADKRRVVRNWIAPSADYLALGGYRSRWDRLAQVARRRRVGEGGCAPSD
jgi:hypothetical protein